MGAGGTATAREAADLVLTDDDFASIAAAVEEGRRVYDNIQKAIAFVLPTNLGEALVILIAVLIGASVAGVIGALGAIPIAGTIQVLVRDWLRTRRERVTPVTDAPL